MKYSILIVEDNESIAKGLAKMVNQYGFEGVIANDLQDIVSNVEEVEPDLILLDINLPYYDGFHWCRKIREITLSPLIIISARDSNLDQVIALESGADDYINKPFNNDVVIAKIKSHIRRCYGDYLNGNSEIVVNGLKLKIDRLTLSYGNNDVMLSSKEVILLQVLMKKHMMVIRREILLEKVWDDQSFVEENTLNVNINRLRKRLADIGLEGVLETVRGVGYQLNIK